MPNPEVQRLVAQTPAQHQSPWLTAAEAAGYVKVERRTLLQWVRQGKVRAFQLSGTMRHVWRFQKTDLDGMLIPSSAGSADGRQQ
jgi:excisionase family DNA binding protein